MTPPLQIEISMYYDTCNPFLFLNKSVNMHKFNTKSSREVEVKRLPTSTCFISRSVLIGRISSPSSSPERLRGFTGRVDTRWKREEKHVLISMSVQLWKTLVCGKLSIHFSSMDKVKWQKYLCYLVGKVEGTLVVLFRPGTKNESKDPLYYI